MKQSDKQGLKAEDQVVNAVRRLMESWEQRDARDGLGIFQRYVEGEFHVRIHFRLAGEDYVAFFERRRGFRDVEEAKHRHLDTPLRHLESIFSGVVYQRLEVMIVVCVTVADFDRSDDVRLHAAYQMRLEPHSSILFLAVLYIQPAHELSGAETG